MDGFEGGSLRRVNLGIETRKRQEIEVFLKLYTLLVESRIYAAFSVLTITISLCVPF